MENEERRREREKGKRELRKEWDKKRRNIVRVR